MNKSKIILTSTAAVLLLSGALSPTVSVFADAQTTPVSTHETLGNEEKSYYFSNADILNYIKQNDPAGYSQINKADISTLLRADMLRAGTNKITFSKGGFKIYLNSSTATWCKNAGAVAIAGLFGAIGTAAGSPIAGGITAAAGAALSMAIGNWNVSKGIWVSYNWLGIMTGHGNQ